MDSPGALQQQVSGSKFRDHRIEIEIEALLDDLRRDNHRALRSSARALDSTAQIDFPVRFAEPYERQLFAPVAFREREARMKQHQLWLAVECDAGKTRLQRRVD